MFVVFNTAIGVLFALTLVPVVRGAALVKASLAQAMLTRAPSASPSPSPYADADADAYERVSEPRWA